MLTNQADPSENNININEVLNYFTASEKGIHILAREKFSNEFFCELRTILMQGNIRKPKGKGKILHCHVYDPNFSKVNDKDGYKKYRSRAMKLHKNTKLYKSIKKYLKGVVRID